MPNWNDLLDEIKVIGSPFDVIRRKYTARLSELTGRNTILYYSGWLQRDEGGHRLSINDNDMNGFMTVVNKMDRSKGVDIVLHTPGGDLAALEAIVDYLRKVFNRDMRAIVPQVAMSAGTMLACSCKSIVMGKQSSLGPIDPQRSGLPAHGILEEFQQAYQEIQADQLKVAVWQPILAKYPPTLIGECQKAIDWSQQLVKEWLVTNMLEGVDQANEIADNIISELGDHALTLSHSRHYPSEKCRSMGLIIENLEDSDDFQDAVLTVHHACIHTLSATPTLKIIENQNGVAFIQGQKTVVLNP
jgi:ATP-dependent protease ClpP protease subunit